MRATLATCLVLLLTGTHSHVFSAARRLANLDEKQVNAVAARIELDLRIGYAFTRFITNSLRTLRGPMENLVISYGELEELTLITNVV